MTDTYAVIVNRAPHTAEACYGQCHDAVQHAVGRTPAERRTAHVHDGIPCRTCAEQREAETAAIVARTHRPAVDDFGNQYLVPAAVAVPLDVDRLARAIEVAVPRLSRWGRAVAPRIAAAYRDAKP